MKEKAASISSLLVVLLAGLAGVGCGSAEDDLGSSAMDFCRRPITSADVTTGFHPRLISSHDRFSAGETLYIRVLNAGTVPVTYGPSPVAERFSGGSWTRQVIRKNGLPLGNPLSATTIGRHVASPCIEIPISANWLPGRYRITQPVSAGDPRHELPLTIAFQVESGRAG
jgi:hypothetical protein